MRLGEEMDFRGRTYFAVAILTTSLTLILPIRAWGFDQESFYVRQPEVEKRELEFEETGPSSQVQVGRKTLIKAMRSKPRTG